MEENIKDKEIKFKNLYKISIYFGLLLIVFLLVQVCLASSVLAADETDKFCYLSDIPYVANQTRVGWGRLHLNETDGRRRVLYKNRGRIL